MLINNNTILPDTDKALRAKCEPVSLPLSDDDRAVLESMINYVRDSHDEEKRKTLGLRAAVGIAAPQVGVLKQMVAISIEGNEKVPPVEYALVNPKIISNSVQLAYLEYGESCLSVVPDREGYVPRYARITVKGYDMLTDKEVTLRLRNYPAIVFQHEIDHLSGILYYDHINKEDPFKELPPDSISIG
ncbi:MAG: peptide deformylase [Erysipelotrichales bacterium]|nr:peptide deformylase [Erysipelotrichales bacterium]